MKKILITGANSYIGTSFQNWLNNFPNSYNVHTVDTINDTWKSEDFSQYDVVFHVAGIAHVDTKNASKETKKLYFKVNRDLTIQVAKKAKKQGVKQFIFMSSIIVYGESNSLFKPKVIDKNTIPNPSNFYGKSKLQADIAIHKLQADNFNVVSIRPPMIYGKGSKGNFPILAKFATISPIFPDFKNQRSILYIDNLCEFIRLIIDYQEKGIFFPQNKHYVSTTQLVKHIASANDKLLFTTRLFNLPLFFLSLFSPLVNKVFGSLLYDKSISSFDLNYNLVNLGDSIFITQKGD